MIELSTIRDLVAIFGVIAGFTYYILTVRNTNKNRDAQVFLQFSNRFSDNRFFKGMQVIHDTNWTNFEHLVSTLSNDEEKNMSWTYVYSAYESLGGLVRGGYIRLPIIAYTNSGNIISVWEKVEPIVEEWRGFVGNARMWSEIEYLYDKIKAYHKAHPETAT